MQVMTNIQPTPELMLAIASELAEQGSEVSIASLIVDKEDDEPKCRPGDFGDYPESPETTVR